MHAQGRYYCTTRTYVRTYVRTPGAFWSVDLDIYTRAMFNIQLTAASKQVFFNDFHLLLSIYSNVQHLTVSN